MKIRFVIVLVLFSVCNTAQIPFTKGVNLSMWFETDSPNKIHFKKYTKQDFYNIKSLGCDIIRMPINLKAMTSGEPDYTLNRIFLDLISKTMDWAEEAGINLIIDNHTPQPETGTPDSVDQELIPIWNQLAEVCKNRSSNIFFEILNEPRIISDQRWNEVLQSVIDEIRKIDQERKIIVGPSSYNGYYRLKAMKEFDDPNVIYTFHFYDPFIFTHQGANWSNPSMLSLKNIPFPYSQEKMPVLPDELKGTWIEHNFNNYSSGGTINKLYELLEVAKEFRDERKVQIFCGEFGVYDLNSNNDDRALWYKLVREYFEKNDIPWTSWDYHGGFGIFEKGSYGMFNHNINVKVAEALGFNYPTQTEFEITPDNTEVDIYSDFIGENIVLYEGISSGFLNLYDNSHSNVGDYNIHLSGLGLYDYVSFNFLPDKDFSYLVDNNYELSFYVKGDAAESQIDLRFIDTKIDSTDHPWRRTITLNEHIVKYDNEWKKIGIPLSEFRDVGSWDDGWHASEGKFDWKAVDKFEIVAEHHILNGKNFWFDEIKILDPKTVGLKTIDDIKSFDLKQNFPNPFNPNTIIAYQIPKDSRVIIKIYDLLGQELYTPVDEYQNKGQYKLSFSGEKLSSGIYIYKIFAEEFIAAKKMILIK